MARILMSKATVGPEEEEALIRAVRSGWVTPLGPEVDAFEAEICDRTGRQHALALSSGTAALHLALLELGARPGTCVVVSSMTFAATANAVAYTGADAVFVDSRESDGNVDPHLMFDAIRTLQGEGREVVAAIPVDLFGRCVEYDVLEIGLAELGVPMLADAAESLGATFKGRAAGAYGRAAAFSFNGNKIMTTSGGGMLVSDDAEMINRARYLSTQARQPAPWYEHTEIGYNYRMSNILAALGRAQLVKLDRFVSRRREIRAMYVEAFGDIEGLRFLGSAEVVDGTADNCWLTAIDLGNAVGVTADEMVAHLDAQDIEGRHLWKPMHLQPVWGSARAFTTGASEGLFRRGVTLPSGYGLTDGEIEQVIESFRDRLVGA
ncbi:MULTISPECIES: DegT/DnrJ/EryC1/StrS aminotransferase family protein [unclassified Dietzia]|uniref:DegT/DnrJ/EryC1/StrS family aminotransferase n=1 Tax=unclassified Dietzia TaxID=2617939 RepID=UPI000D22B89B|nr:MULTISPECIES: DegT/DnrJ/EryC1/StrS family aminotransferase [unclassified Dietzia]AVZ40293.1 pyridoxal-5'-phosphate-dependent protein [Dietzia sp. JS16-p6b]QGW25771.1 DegT/DnrJ/EryC1/StrS aminotransferase [Dietzia sp. DQ12-45-1b]